MWSEHMQAALQSKYLWLIVNGTETCPAAPPTTRPATTSVMDHKAEKKEHLDWLLQDGAVQGAIKSACEDSQLPHVKDNKMAKEMWDTLRKVL